MDPMIDPLRSLRWTALVEAVSWPVLLFVAMPLKHWWGIPGPVRYIGMAHGVLFMLLIWFLARAHFERQWPVGRLMRIFVASLVPVWPFFLDREVRGWIAESAAAA